MHDFISNVFITLVLEPAPPEDICKVHLSTYQFSDLSENSAGKNQSYVVLMMAPKKDVHCENERIYIVGYTENIVELKKVLKRHF